MSLIMYVWIVSPKEKGQGGHWKIGGLGLYVQRAQVYLGKSGKAPKRRRHLDRDLKDG